MARSRTRTALDEAELQLVDRVVVGGRIGLWRAEADQRLKAAMTAFARHGRVSRRVAAGLVVALADETIRDRAWRMIESDGDTDWPAFWLHLSRRALPPYRTEPLFLVAWSAWRAGDLRSARSAAVDVQRQEQGHRAAAMLLALLFLGVEPEDLPSLVGRSVTRSGA